MKFVRVKFVRVKFVRVMVCRVGFGRVATLRAATSEGLVGEAEGLLIRAMAGCAMNNRARAQIRHKRGARFRPGGVSLVFRVRKGDEPERQIRSDPRVRRRGLRIRRQAGVLEETRDRSELTSP